MLFFKRKTTETRAISGITASDWITIYNTILREYNNTAKDHRHPTEYMRGLHFALKVPDSIRPYNVMSAGSAETK